MELYYDGDIQTSFEFIQFEFTTIAIVKEICQYIPSKVAKVKVKNKDEQFTKPYDIVTVVRDPSDVVSKIEEQFDEDCHEIRFTATDVGHHKLEVYLNDVSIGKGFFEVLSFNDFKGRHRLGSRRISPSIQVQHRDEETLLEGTSRVRTHSASRERPKQDPTSDRRRTLRRSPKIKDFPELEVYDLEDGLVDDVFTPSVPRVSTSEFGETIPTVPVKCDIKGSTIETRQKHYEEHKVIKDTDTQVEKISKESDRYQSVRQKIRNFEQKCRDGPTQDDISSLRVSQRAFPSVRSTFRVQQTRDDQQGVPFNGSDVSLSATEESKPWSALKTKPPTLPKPKPWSALLDRDTLPMVESGASFSEAAIGKKIQEPRPWLPQETKPWSPKEVKSGAALETEAKPWSLKEVKSWAAPEAETKPWSPKEIKSWAAPEAETKPWSPKEVKPWIAPGTETKPSSAPQAETKPWSMSQSETKPRSVRQPESKPWSALEQVPRIHEEKDDVSQSPIVDAQAGNRTTGPTFALQHGLTDTNKPEPDNQQQRLKFMRLVRKKDEAAFLELLKESLPDCETASRAIRTFGPKSDTTVHILEAICTKLRESNSTIQDIVVGYKIPSSCIPVFTLYTVDDALDISQRKRSFPLDTYEINVRARDFVSDEAREVLYSSTRKRKRFSKDDIRLIRRTISENAEDLFQKHSNLVIISACPVRSKAFGSKRARLVNERCLVFYVPVKGLIPIGENPFPEKIGDFPVDVREGGYKYFGGHKANNYHQNLRLGCSIRCPPVPQQGTLGAFVELPDHKTGCLTSAHVVFSPEELCSLSKHSCTLTIQDNSFVVFQPSSSPDSPRTGRFGSVRKAVWRKGGIATSGVDAVLIEIDDTERMPIDGYFPDGSFDTLGFSNDKRMKYTSGRIVGDLEELSDRFNHSHVFKFGSTSGITQGSFHVQGMAIRRQVTGGIYRKFGYELLNQIEILAVGTDFAEPGDSGALVFVSEENKADNLLAIGMVEGGTFYGTTIVTPIADVLDALELPPYLKSFEPTDAMDRFLPQQNIGVQHQLPVNDSGDSGCTTLGSSSTTISNPFIFTSEPRLMKLEEDFSDFQAQHVEIQRQLFESEKQQNEITNQQKVIQQQQKEMQSQQSQMDNKIDILINIVQGNNK